MKIILIMAGVALIAACNPVYAQTPPDSPPVAATPPPASAPAMPAINVVVTPPVTAESRVNGLVGTICAIIAGLVFVVGFGAKKVIELLPAIAEARAAIAELKGRQDRQAAKTGSLQEQVTANARAIPTGNGHTETPPVVAPFAVLAFALFLFAATGCETMSGNATKDRRGRITNAVASEAFSAVLKIGLGVGLNALEGRNGQDAAGAVFASATQIDGGAALARVLKAAAGPEIAPIANVAARQFDAAKPQTAAERKFLADTIGAAIQASANTVAAK